MDLSTIGVKFGWAVEETAGTKPKAFTWIKRCSKIAGINVTKDKIDVSCFEDKIKQYIAGVGDTGGDWNLNFNGSKDFVTACVHLWTKTRFPVFWIQMCVHPPFPPWHRLTFYL